MPPRVDMDLILKKTCKSYVVEAMRADFDLDLPDALSEYQIIEHRCQAEVRGGTYWFKFYDEAGTGGKLLFEGGVRAIDDFLKTVLHP